MSRDIVSAAPDTGIADLVHLMNQRRIKRVPVIDNGKLVGIVSRANLVRALVKAFVKKPARAVADDKIWTSILDAITAEPWGRASRSMSPSKTVSSISMARLPMNASASRCMC